MAESDVRTSWFPTPIAARFIRVQAPSYPALKTGVCFRIDLYGCNHSKFRVRADFNQTHWVYVSVETSALCVSGHSYNSRGCRNWNLLANAKKHSKGRNERDCESGSKWKCDIQHHSIKTGIRAPRASTNTSFISNQYLSLNYPIVLRPRISLKSQRLIPVENSFVDVACKVSSEPPVVVKWWLGNVDVTSHSTSVQSEDLAGNVIVSSLRVNFISLEDIRNKYDCNADGTGSLQCALTFRCTAHYPDDESGTLVNKSADVYTTLCKFVDQCEALSKRYSEFETGFERVWTARFCPQGILSARVRNSAPRLIHARDNDVVPSSLCMGQNCSVPSNLLTGGTFCVLRPPSRERARFSVPPNLPEGTEVQSTRIPVQEKEVLCPQIYLRGQRFSLLESPSRGKSSVPSNLLRVQRFYPNIRRGQLVISSMDSITLTLNTLQGTENLCPSHLYKGREILPSWIFACDRNPCTSPSSVELIFTSALSEEFIKLLSFFPAIFSAPGNITEGPHSKEKLLGESSSLKCVTYGFPAPTITWLKDGAPLKSDRFRVTNEVDKEKSTMTSVLSLSKLERGDSGIYTCRADRQLLDAPRRASANLLVLGTYIYVAHINHFQVQKGTFSQCISEVVRIDRIVILLCKKGFFTIVSVIPHNSISPMIADRLGLYRLSHIILYKVTMIRRAFWLAKTPLYE